MADQNKADAAAYQNKFIAKAYGRVNLTMPKGRKEVVQARGESVNGFVNRAVSETVERDGEGGEQGGN